MNKKTLLIVASVAALLLIVGGVFAALYFNSASEEKKSENKAEKVSDNTTMNLEDNLLFYVNLGQLGDKSALDKVFTEANRSLMSNLLTGGINSKYVESLLSNLDATGLDIDKPIYSYANIEENGVEVVIVAEVANVDAVDSFIEFVSEASGLYIDVEHNGKTRAFSIENIYFAYNEDRFVMTTSITDDYFIDGEALVAKALKRSQPDLSAYAHYDIAVSLKLMPILDAVRAQMQATIDECYEYIDYLDEWEKEWYLEQIANIENYMNQMNAAAELMDKNSSITLGLAFEPGKIVLDMSIDGISYEHAGRKVSNDHLAYVDGNAIGVMNMGVDGEIASKLISEYITPDYAQMFGLSRNEFSFYLGIIEDAVKSINGDVTVALNNFNPYSEKIDAMLAVSVDDDNIISNVAQFGSGFLKKRGDNCYGVNYAGNNISLGQEGDVFYATINENFELQSASANEAAWANEVSNGYGYFVVDINNLMKNSYISSSFHNELYYMDSFSAELINNFVKSCSYAYLSIETPTSVQFVLGFDDQKTNALEQLVRMVVPAAISELTNSIF